MNQENKFCRNCGSQLSENEMFCKKCGMQVNNNQEVYNNYSSNNVPKRTNNALKVVIVGGIILFIIIIIAVGVYLTYIKKDSSNDYNDNNPIEDKEKSILTNKVSFEGFTIDIPNNYSYEIEGTTLSFNNNSGTWYAGVQVVNSDYNLLVTNKNQIISSIQSRGYEVGTYDQKTYSGMPCIVMETVGMGQKMIMSYVKINSSKVFVVSVVNMFKDYDYDLLADIVKILSTVK